MFQFLRQLWHRLCARLRFCGGVQYLAGTASLPSPLSPAEEKALLARMAAGEADARDALILHNLRLVVFLARKFESSGVGTEDLISIGTIGLMKAINTFNTDKNIKLATYASRCIENEILMFLRRNNKIKTEKKHYEKDIEPRAADVADALRLREQHLRRQPIRT